MVYPMRNDALYMIVPYGIGDAMILCGLKSVIEKQYGAEVIPVLKPSHELVAKMYDIGNYLVRSFNIEELLQIASEQNLLPGKMFVAHPAFTKRKLDEDFLNHKLGFVEMFREFLGIENGDGITLPKFGPEYVSEIDEEALKIKIGVSNFDDVILVAPEIKSASESERIQDEWYLNKIHEYEKHGYKVVVNCDAHRSNYTEHAVDMTLDELAYLGTKAKKVISVRSGFCDLIYLYSKSMDVLYPNVAFYDLFCMKQIFANIESRTRELIVNISELLKRREYKNVALYGYGEVGKRILYSLNKEGFYVKYVIDKSAEKINDVDAYYPSDKLPDVDVVLVTILIDVNEIRKMMQLQSKEVVFLKELMEDIGHESSSVVLGNII